MARCLLISIFSVVLVACGNGTSDVGDDAESERATVTEQATSVVPARPDANGFLILDGERFSLETASLRCAPRETHDGISEIRFQTFGMGGEGREAYNVSAREQVHRNGTVSQHISAAGQALGISSIGTISNSAREGGRNWPLYRIEDGRITIRATLQSSEITAEWDVPAKFTEDC